MGYILDLIVLVLIVISVLISMKRGFVKTAVELAGFVLAVYLAFSVSPVLSQATYDKAVKPAVTSALAKAFNETAASATENVSTAIWDAMPDFVTKNAEILGISQDIISKDYSNIASADVAQTAASLSDKVVKPVAEKALGIIYGLIIFVVVAVISKLLAKPINSLFSISFIGSINRVLGAVLGVGKGIIYAVVFCAVISSAVVFTKSGFLCFTRESIEATVLFKLLCGLNPIY